MFSTWHLLDFSCFRFKKLFNFMFCHFKSKNEMKRFLTKNCAIVLCLHIWLVWKKRITKLINTLHIIVKV